MINTINWLNLTKDEKAYVIQQDSTLNYYLPPNLTIEDQELIVNNINSDQIEEFIFKHRSHAVWLLRVNLTRLITDKECLYSLYLKIKNTELKKQISQSSNFPSSAELILKQINE